MNTNSYNEQINKFYNSVIWTHKIQKTYLESLELRRKVFAIIQIIVAAIASAATVIFAIFGNQIGTILSSIGTMLCVIFSSILEKIETKENIDAFRKSSNSLWLLRGEVEDLVTKIKNNSIATNEIEYTIILLRKSFDVSTQNLPTIPNRFVKKAGEKINDRKDEEVDNKVL